MGSAQLLMSQKFQQFYWLCQQNMVSRSQVCSALGGSRGGGVSTLPCRRLLGVLGAAEQGANSSNVLGWGSGW